MPSSNVAISVEHLSKEFHIGKIPSYGRFSELLQNSLFKIFKKDQLAENQETFLALDDINFEVKQGEILGIIGRNGAGKSTLLKILSRITPPTSGRIGIRGRIGSLLEVGTGFHPELTGRENVFLNGTIIGMKKREITRHFAEIVAFAEVEKFIDTPVKHYSSGMYMRLAFSVAAHLDPEILIVDEVLAVGDTGFQQKCLEKMKAIGLTGKTIIFVSHQMNVVRNLCSTCIWLDQGKSLLQGNTQEIVQQFQQSWDSTISHHWQGSQHSFDGKVELTEVEILSTDNDTLQRSLLVELPLNLRIVYKVHQAGNFNPSILIYTDDNQILFSGAPVLGYEDEIDHIHHQRLNPGLMETTCIIPANIMQPGTYSLTVNFNDHDGKLMMNQLNLLTFKLEDNGVRKRDFMGKWLGLIRPPMKWITTQKTLNTD